jgi:hypothetical protein
MRAEGPPGKSEGRISPDPADTTTEQLTGPQQTVRHSYFIATAAGRGDHLAVT